MLLGICGCATQKFYHGVDATNLTGLFYGMTRLDAEAITGNPKRVLQCVAGSIVTYVYDRGYTGCIIDRTCNPENETNTQTIEIIGDFFYIGLPSMSINECITQCQKGHLELFFDGNNRLIGAREVKSDRDNFCWIKRNNYHDNYKCRRIYTYRRPSTVPESLLLEIYQEDISVKFCDQFPLDEMAH